MAVLFGKFEVFQNRYGEFEVANENEIVLTDRITGYKSKCNIEKFCNFIKKIYPDKEEQKQLLIDLLRD